MDQPAGRLLLIIDQFEELHTLHAGRNPASFVCCSLHETPGVVLLNSRPIWGGVTYRPPSTRKMPIPNGADER
jgi:hypothetical protein